MKNNNGFWKIAFITSLLFIIMMSLIPRDNNPALINGNDWQLTSTGFFQHVFAFGMSTWLGLKAYQKALYIITGMLIIGLLLEFIQIYLPWRTFNLYDILANTVGIALVSVFLLMR